MKDGVLFSSPASNTERQTTASACVRNLGIRIPALLDSIEDRVERAYTAWPDRLFLIDRGGRIAFRSAPGPFGFEPRLLEDALRRLAPPNS